MLPCHNEFMASWILSTEGRDPDTQLTWKAYLPPAFPVAREFMQATSGLDLGK